MKKVGIITLNDNNNYGNRLQNYAVQTVLNSLGNISYNIENYRHTNIKDKYFLRRLKFFNFDRHYSNNSKRKENFVRFNKNIKYEHKLFNVFSKYSQYDYMLVGSDQVWHPTFGLTDATLLTSIPSQKRIAYSASFGVSTIDDVVAENIRDEMKKFKAISVRETSGADIVERITGKRPDVLVDPTLMLNREMWNKLEINPTISDEKYIFVYFLGGNNEKVIELSNKWNLKVYDVLDAKQEKIYSSGPAEFLYLLDHSELVLTDSFHACVFSFLFNKPFLVFDRIGGASMSTRIEELLSKFYLERKYAKSRLDNDIWEHNYTEGYKQLEIEREKTIKFLEEALRN